MPRRPREQMVGGIYHVFARGNGRHAVFRDDHDRRVYLELLAKTVTRTDWRLLAYCLMTTHMHLVLETPRANLASGMQWLHGHYARRFNDRHDHVGHVFQGRYKAVRAKTDEQLAQTIRYVVLNPVEAGLTIRPEAYEWSSHHAFLSQRWPSLLDARRLLALFGGEEDEARERYLRFVEDKLNVSAPGFEPATYSV